MKKILSLVLVLAVMLGAVATLASCGAPEDDGAQIAVYLGDGVYDLDPSDYYVNDNAAQLMSLIYEPLFRLTKKGKLALAAADKYTVDEKERTITVELKESYWSDGARVKADDFVYAWRNAILDPTKATAAAPLFYDIENAVEIKNGELSIYEFGVVASNYELIITYREGADYERLLMNLASIAAAPIREDVMNLAPAHWSKNANTITTNGPFKVKTLDFNLGELTLERNVGYHQPTTIVDYDNEVIPYRLVSTFSVGNDKVELTYGDIENKTVFYLGEASLEDRKANKDKALTADLASTYTYVFNTENPLFAIKEVRQALSLAVDRSAIVDAITFGKVATGLLPSVSSQSIYNKKNTQNLTATDMQAAKDLIAGVNFGSLEKKFTLTVNDDAESIAIAEIVKASWKELGFDVTVKKVDSTASTIMDKATDTRVTIYDSTVQYLVNGALDGATVGYDVIAVDLQTYTKDAFVTLAGFTTAMNGSGVSLKDNATLARANIARWSNAEYDALIEAAYNETDADRRAETLRAAESILVDEAPVIPVIFNVNYAFVSDELSDIEIDGFGNFSFTDAELDDYHNYLPKKEEPEADEGTETEE